MKGALQLGNVKLELVYIRELIGTVLVRGALPFIYSEYMRLYLLGKNSSGIQLYMEEKPSCHSPIFSYSIPLSSSDAVILSWEPTRPAEQINIKLLLTLNCVWLMQFIRIFERWHVIGLGSHT